jgi:hypothetical protein
VPRVAAASSKRRSTASIERRIARTISGKPITAQASAAEGEDDAEPLVEELAERAAPAEEQQQEVSGYHRRHDERQMNYPVEQGFSPEPSARQHQRHEDSRY